MTLTTMLRKRLAMNRFLRVVPTGHFDWPIRSADVSKVGRDVEHFFAHVQRRLEADVPLARHDPINESRRNPADAVCDKFSQEAFDGYQRGWFSRFTSI